MRVDGKAIAEEIFEKLKKRVYILRKKNIIPTLVIILIGENPASISYVKQKQLKATQVGIETILIHLPSDIEQAKVLATIEQSNNDNHVHGIIVQRPLPNHIDEKVIDESVLAEKDIDGFRKDSKFDMPLAAAVLKILENIYASTTGVDAQKFQSFIGWLKAKNIIVVGKGSTGGKPTIEVLKRWGINTTVVDSKTPNPQEIIRQGDLVVTAVGKPNIIKASMLKKDVILIGVGMHRGEDNKLHGDYNEEEIKNITSFYTPIPGGIGPVNVAMLLENTVKAAEIGKIFRD